ncbi:MAG: hypothetical protein L6Q54_15775 [Leptospiraceae bacterium]|nr:hypothetical protein [Leptospiraceae bacterium]MCK6382695.1 hypothetical protein [Leptospiraceae bacterium]
MIRIITNLGWIFVVALFGFACITFTIDVGLGSCYKMCENEGKEFSNFGWDIDRKPVCTCKERK